MKKLISLILVLTFILCPALHAFAEADITEKIYSQLPHLAKYEQLNITENETGYFAQFSSEGKNSVSLMCDIDGTVKNYSLSYILGVINKLPTVTKQTARVIAKNFLETAASDIFAQLDIENAEITYSGVSTSEYSVYITRVINGIPFAGDSVTVWIDGHSGTVIRYIRNWNKNSAFDENISVMPLDMAQSAYSEKTGTSLRYLKTADSSQQIKLVYMPEKTGYIDASDGSFIFRNKDIITNQYEQITAQFEKNVLSSSQSYNQTPVAPEDKLLENAKKIIADLKLDISDVEALKYYYSNDKAVAEITFGNKLKIMLDAHSAELIGFYTESSYNILSSLQDEDLTLLSDSFVKKYFSNYLSELSLPVVSVKNGSNGTVYEITYTRTLYGIPFYSNGVQILINGLGEITSASVLWDNCTFPAPDGVISKDTAEKLFFEKIGIVITYINTDSNQLKAVYMANPKFSNIIDAVTGEILSYDGTVAKENETFSYTDLETHYAQKQAQTLLNCGIFISSGKTALKDNITQENFIKLLANIFPGSLPIYGNANRPLSDSELEMLYNFFVTEGILQKSEINPDGFITREDAVKLILNTAGYKKVAQFDGIFKQIFNDNKDISPSLYGYIALAKGFGIISGNGESFFPKKFLTNGDALIMIYNYLN